MRIGDLVAEFGRNKRGRKADAGESQLECRVLASKLKSNQRKMRIRKCTGRNRRWPFYR